KVLEWIPLRQEFLDEILRFEGSEYFKNGSSAVCQACNVPGADLRCTRCGTRALYCDGCVVKRHRNLELHILERWVRGKFVKTDLRSLGAVVQLGHDSAPCPRPSSQTRNMVVVDLDRIHEVRVRFCECVSDDNSLPEWVQIFRHGWFPATTLRPATSITFRALDFFQELNFQAKTTLNDFERTLWRVTDNSGSCARPLIRYKQFSHCIRLWRHLVALKRAGRAHDPAGAAATQPGDLAVECPACPHPGINLPPGWETADDGVR
ncbi:uncharacterized protein BXZ73DRAFT_56700, partial [Epithele typhae]|uniref:uncharacterized protein n=1 Tax=Epithele typhae TaxID=378194 RepID=UPI00200822F5